MRAAATRTVVKAAAAAGFTAFYAPGSAVFTGPKPVASAGNGEKTASADGRAGGLADRLRKRSGDACQARD